MKIFSGGKKKGREYFCQHICTLVNNNFQAEEKVTADGNSDFFFNE